MDIVTANASKESDKLQILNSIALPRAATKQLQMDAAVSHERDSEMKTWAMKVARRHRVTHQNPLEAKLPFGLCVEKSSRQGHLRSDQSIVVLRPTNPK